MVRSAATNSCVAACMLATGDATTRAGAAGQIADSLEETFEATGSRGGLIPCHSQGGARGRTLRDNVAG